MRLESACLKRSSIPKASDLVAKYRKAVKLTSGGAFRASKAWKASSAAGPPRALKATA